MDPGPGFNVVRRCTAFEQARLPHCQGLIKLWQHHPRTAPLQSLSDVSQPASITKASTMRLSGLLQDGKEPSTKKGVQELYSKSRSIAITLRMIMVLAVVISQ